MLAVSATERNARLGGFFGDVARTVALTVLPLMVFSIALAVALSARERTSILETLPRRVAAAASELDLTFDRHIVMLATLAGSSALDRDDLRGFYLEAQRAAEGRPEWLSIILSDPQSGRQLLNTRRPFGEPLPVVRDLESHLRAVNTGQPLVVSNPQVRGPFTERPVLGIRVPVIRDGRVKYVLSASLEPRSLIAVFHVVALPSGWRARVIDPNGIVIACERCPDDNIGRPVGPRVSGLVSARRSGTVNAPNPEGIDSYIAVEHAPRYGWTLSMTMPTAAVRAVATGNLWIVGTAGIICVALSIVMIGVQTRRRREALALMEELVAERTAALRESESRLLEAQQIAALGRWEFDLATQTITWSDEVFRIFGRDSKAGTPSFEELRGMIHPEDRPRFDSLVQAAVERGEAFETEWRALRPDGSYRWKRTRARPFRDSAGRVTRIVGTDLDVTDLKRAEERQRLLIREIDHRAKNLLAVVQGMVRLSQAGSLEDYRRELEGRISCLANAHSILSESQWTGADLENLLRREVAAFESDGEPRVVTFGAAVAFIPQAAQPMAIVFHELTTNSVKYGALSKPSGRVTVTWEVHAGRGLSLSWREIGGPAIAPPRRTGLGTLVIEQTVRNQLAGDVEFHWRADGLVCGMELPRDALVLSKAAA